MPSMPHFLSRLSSKSSGTTKSERPDSAVDVVSPPLSPTSSLTLAFEVPKPSTPYSGPKLVKKSLFRDTRQPKTLQQLISSTCQTSCELALRRGVVCGGTNLLVTDPAVVDFLLICLSHVSGEEGWRRGRWFKPKQQGVRLLPRDCPMKGDRIRKLADELELNTELSSPSLAAVVSTTTTKTTTATTAATATTAMEQIPEISSSSTSMLSTSATSTKPPKEVLEGMKKQHRALLLWLLTSPFAHLSTLSPTHPELKFPSLAPLKIHTFLTTHQPPHKDRIFHAYASRPGHIRQTVFHGTHPSRLPLILSQGLRNMSGTRYQRHGRSYGSGIYLARDAQTSLGYSYGVECWKGSRWGSESGSPKSPQSPLVVPGVQYPAQNQSRVKVLLGCEVVIPTSKQYESVIVEKDEGKVVVRFVWLVPDYVYDMGPGFVKEVQDAMEALRKIRGE